MGNRKLLREMAKKEYKKRCKGVPKRNRTGFSQFLKDFLATRSNEDVSDKDFDFEELVDVNEISDNNLEE